MKCAALLISLSIMATAGCASLSEDKNVSYQISIDGPHRIRFSGKGAGAGVMLSSSMGPMGIAIGVAIDEGIAKEIHAAFESAGHTVEALVAAAVDEAVSANAQFTEHEEPVVIRIQRLGVKMAQEEMVIADIDGEVVSSTGNEISRLEAVDDSEPVPLAKLRRDGDASFALVKEALVRTLVR